MRKKELKVYITKKQYEIENTDQLLALMEIYLSEWMHRDNLFYKEIFTYFFSSLVVMILPFADIWGLHLPKALPGWLFQCVGMLMAFVFLIVSSGYIARFKALNAPYQALIEKLPPSYRRKTVKELYPGAIGKLLNWRMASLVCTFMFLSLIVVGAVLLYFTLR